MKDVRGADGDERGAAPDVRVQVLGGFGVTVGERVIGEEAWRLRKAAGLVKLLALAAGHRLHREQLLEALWPEMTAEAANNNLRRTLHFARRVLEPGKKGSTYLTWHGDQLALSAPGGVAVDVAIFEQAAAEASRGGNIEACRAALALYGGELLPEDRYEDWAISRRESVQRLYLSLLVALGRLHVQRGEQEAAIATYRRVVSLEALHEEAHVALMRLYAVGGRRGQALQQYRELADALEQELGVAPDAETERLQQEIREGRFANVTTSPSQQAPQRAVDNLPHALTSFVGREREMALVEELLAKTRLLTLTGAGGSGKTRLALEAARMLLEQYAGGVCLVELASLAEPDLVPETVVKALSLTQQAGLSAEETLVRHLQSRNVLLVVDNCEHLSDAVARLLDTLLRRAPGLRVLATSRQALEMMGEALLPVPPLTVPGEHEAEGDLLGFEACRLFVARAQLAQPTFALSADNGPTVARLCRRLDGLPLAIELAAARLSALTVEEVAAGLEDRFALLTRGNRTALPRQQTLRAVMAWSTALLSEGEQMLFRRLAPFAGGASLEAVESVCNHDGDLPFGSGEGVTRLAHKSLLLLGQDGEGERRVTMLETVQAYAQEQLVLAGELKRLSRLHAHYFVGLAEMAAGALHGPQQVMWLALLDREHDNFRAALRWAETAGDGQSGLRLAAALWRFWMMRSYSGEGRDWCMRMLATAPADADARHIATVMKGAGGLSYRQGDYAAARAFFEKALTLAKESDDLRNVSELLNNLGLVAHSQGDYTDAQALYEESLTLTRTFGDPFGVARTLNNMGMTAIFRGDYAAARLLLTDCLALARETGNKGTEDNALNNLGMLAIHEESYDEARALNEERLVLARQLGNRVGIASALNNLGVVASGQGDDGAAEKLFEESLVIAEEIGDRGTLAWALQNLGGVAARRGDADEARHLYRESLDIATETGDRYLVARILEQAAALAVRESAPLRAARLAGAAEALRQAMHAPLPPSERAALAQEMAKARAMVEKAAWQAAWEQGGRLSAEEAMAEPA